MEKLIHENIYFAETRYFGIGILDLLERAKIIPLKIIIVKLKHNERQNHYLFVFQVTSSTRWYIDGATDFSGTGGRMFNELTEYVNKMKNFFKVPVVMYEIPFEVYWLAKHCGIAEALTPIEKLV